MSQIRNVSRRSFMHGMLTAGTLILGCDLFPTVVCAASGDAHAPVENTDFHPNVFVAVDSQGTVSIIAHRSEMGNGSRTTLPRVVADELDADWNRVKIVQAIGDAKYGAQDTDASQSIRMFFDTMREAGATARLMLVRAGARRWSVPESECETRVHQVFHVPTARSLSYGDLALAASHLLIPQKGEVHLKPRSAWRYIGKDASLYDLEDICRGKAMYGIDTRLDGMVYASIERPPAVGGAVRNCNDRKTLRVPGVQKVLLLESATAPFGAQALGGVAVIADNTWAAFRGRQKLEIEWEHGANAVYDSADFNQKLREVVRRPCKVVRNEGNVDQEFAKQAKTIEAEYFVPHLAHAPMEPPSALVDVRGDNVTAWVPVQNPQAVQDVIAKSLGLKKEDVTCHVTLLGGGFGRKSFSDFVAEAAILSRKLEKPVKVVWTREDDIRFDYYLPVAAVYMKATFDANGKPTAWLQRSAFPPINSTFNSEARYASWELNNTWIEAPFDIPNLRIENGPAQAHVRLGWLRSVASVYHTFAVQSFAAELASSCGADPLAYLLDLFGPPRILDLKIPNYKALPNFPFDVGRLRRVTELAAEKASWGKRALGKGQGMGIAAHRYGYAYVAAAVEAEVSTTGFLRIPRVDLAVDCGTAVNPANIRAQLEGAAVFGVSIARFGEITAAKGAVQQSNFDDYPVTRISEAPQEIHVHIVESNAPPAGVGEAGVSVIPPALCNAIFAAIGKRIRDLPLALASLT